MRAESPTNASIWHIKCLSRSLSPVTTICSACRRVSHCAPSGHAKDTPPLREGVSLEEEHDKGQTRREADSHRE
jgi:hypothetical protein